MCRPWCSVVMYPTCSLALPVSRSFAARVSRVGSCLVDRMQEGRQKNGLVCALQPAFLVVIVVVGLDSLLN